MIFFPLVLNKYTKFTLIPRQNDRCIDSQKHNTNQPLAKSLKYLYVYKYRYFKATYLLAAAIELQFEDQIQKSQQKVLKKVDKLKATVKGLKSHVSKLEDMLEAILRANNIQYNTDETTVTSSRSQHVYIWVVFFFISNAWTLFHIQNVVHNLMEIKYVLGQI